MQPFLLVKPVAHSTASKFSAVLIGRIDSRYIFNSVLKAMEVAACRAALYALQVLRTETEVNS